jgi:hypothetical protein
MLTARTKKDALRKQDELKIRELRMRELAIVTIRVARAASMCLRLRMDGRAALGTREWTGRYSAIASNV